MRGQILSESFLRRPQPTETLLASREGGEVEDEKIIFPGKEKGN